MYKLWDQIVNYSYWTDNLLTPRTSLHEVKKLSDRVLCKIGFYQPAVCVRTAQAGSRIKKSITPRLTLIQIMHNLSLYLKKTHLGLHYKEKVFFAVKEDNRCLLRESYTIHRHTVRQDVEFSKLTNFVYILTPRF